MKPLFSLLTIPFAIGVLGTLSGCQTVQDQRIPLSNEFAQRAEVIAVRKPIAQYKDQHFEQNTNAYVVRSMMISRGRTERSDQLFSSTGVSGVQLQSADRFTRFLWNEILGMRPNFRQQYKLASEREYRFQVLATVANNPSAQAPTIDVQCQLYGLDDVAHSERIGRDRKGNESNASVTERQRLYAFLRCELELNHQVWELRFDADGNQLPIIQFGRPISESANDYFKIEHERGSQFLVNGQWRDSPFPISSSTGLHFFKDDKQVAAMSFDGQAPKVWLSKSNDANSNQLLFAASYALMMYDWLDHEWRSNY